MAPDPEQPAAINAIPPSSAATIDKRLTLPRSPRKTSLRRSARASRPLHNHSNDEDGDRDNEDWDRHAVGLYDPAHSLSRLPTAGPLPGSPIPAAGHLSDYPLPAAHPDSKTSAPHSLSPAPDSDAGEGGERGWVESHSSTAGLSQSSSSSLERSSEGREVRAERRKGVLSGLRGRTGHSAVPYVTLMDWDCYLIIDELDVNAIVPFSTPLLKVLSIRPRLVSSKHIRRRCWSCRGGHWG
ncbi:hypothetical protein I350_03123 [Cryptococcus amylolentus CBS 6273]|uniref:Uncharacterized protein n=1 Tax=Cryptococcus amylolentus CBS 6273 TaxID=1296118 RepID=A0A1E3K8R0_9TREE|nr:hypothetical protein I350_03123 [Cryptococcus amylolentus CBS 6273]